MWRVDHCAVHCGTEYWDFGVEKNQDAGLQEAGPFMPAIPEISTSSKLHRGTTTVKALQERRLSPGVPRNKSELSSNPSPGAVPML